MNRAVFDQMVESGQITETDKPTFKQMVSIYHKMVDDSTERITSDRYYRLNLFYENIGSLLK
ncbi:MAG: hypothetical protein PHS33_08925 [Candidatus Omnitrophica bacterium]|nr:hypothetical protein [Candidatus Omnitrophota bacterium]